MNNLNPLLEMNLGPKPGFIRKTWNGIRNAKRHAKRYGTKESIQRVKTALETEQGKISRQGSEEAIGRIIKHEAPKNPLGELGANHDVRQTVKKNVKTWAGNARAEAKKQQDHWQELVDNAGKRLKAKARRKAAESARKTRAKRKTVREEDLN